MRDHEDENLAALGLKQYHYQAQKGCFLTPLFCEEKAAGVGRESS